MQRASPTANTVMALPQRGGALMVSMVLIFMMSLMGIQAMRSANLDKRMSTNAVHKSRTLQAAESATELAYEDRQSMGLAFTSRQDVHVPVTLNSHQELQTEAVMEYVGMGMVPGASTTFMGPKFQVTGSATLNNISATSIIVQGSYLPAPAN